MSERDVAYARRGWLLTGLRDEPDFHAPYYPPVPAEVYDAFPAEYREYVPWEWTGDLEAVRTTQSAWTGERLHEDRAHPERMFVDVGYVAQLKRCGFSTVYSGSCPFPRDERLHTFERRIQANRRAMWNAVGSLLDGVAAVVSFIPVIGQAVSVVLAAAAAVATRRPIGSALVGLVVAAVPGGAAVRDAVVPAAEFGKSILEGGEIEEAVIAAARAFAVEVGGESAGTAFDLVLAVSRGEDLQAAGFQLASKWFTGTGAGDKAARFGLRAAHAAASGESIERVLAREARNELAQLGPIASTQRDVDAAIRALIAEPRHFLGSIEAFAASHGLAREIARAAFMSVRPDAAGGLRESSPFRGLLVDPSAPILGESRMIERVREWARPKRDLAAALRVEATHYGPLASSSYYDALRPVFLTEEEWSRDAPTIPAPAPVPIDRAPTSGGRGGGASSSNVVAGILGVGGVAALGLVLATRKR